MTDRQRDLLQERCVAFRRIRSINRFFTACHYALDFYLLYILAIEVLVVRHYNAMAVMAVIMTKLIAVFMLKGRKSNYIGLAATVTYFPMLAYFEQLDFYSGAIVTLTIMSHVFRIIPCTLAERTENLYGAPGFSGFLISSEMEKDPQLANTILASYNNASEDALTKLGLKDQTLSKYIRPLKYVGVLIMIFGGTLVFSTHVTSVDLKDLNSGKIDDSLSGKYVNATCDKIYSQYSMGDICGYICRVEGQCIAVQVTDEEMIKQFDSLYRYYDDSQAKLLGEVDEGSDKPVRFMAKVKKIDKHAKVKPDNKYYEDIDDDLPTVTGLSLNTVSTQMYKQVFRRGISVLIFGGAVLVLYAVLFLTNSRQIENI